MSATSATAFSGMDRSWYRELHGYTPVSSPRNKPTEDALHCNDSSPQASNKADYGLEDLQNLNMKDRFSVFERSNDDHERDRELPASVEVKRSQSILNKMKKFQGRREGGGTSSGDESCSEMSGDEQQSHDPDVVRSQRRYKKERPMSFSGMGDVKSRFEAGAAREQPPTDADTKGELAQLRGMICGGSLRATYERAVQQSGGARPSSRQSPDSAEVPRSGTAAGMTWRFESGSASLPPETEDASGDAAHQNGTAVAGTDGVSTPDKDRVASPGSDHVSLVDTELLHSDTAKRMLNKFKQMEQNSSTASTKADEEGGTSREVAHGNAREVLSKFRQIQENALREDLPDGPPPPKSFTPPPEEPAASSEQDATDEDLADDPDIVKASQKLPDEFLNKKTDQARSLRDKFETWESQRPGEAGFSVEEDCRPSLEITRNMRAKFESLGTPPARPVVERAAHKPSRFIMESGGAAEMCGACSKRVYAMERLEVDKRILHKNCFRCNKCNCVLRMDTYTFNAGQLYCVPHFKQMFKTKGNYDEGFGLESRTKHWSSNGHSDTAASATAASDTARINLETNGAHSPEPAQHVNGQCALNGSDGADADGGEGTADPAQDSAVLDEDSALVSEDAEIVVEHEREEELERHEREGEVMDPLADADVFDQVYESTVAQSK